MSQRVSPPTANAMFLFPQERTHASERVEYPSSKSTLAGTDEFPQPLHLLAPSELNKVGRHFLFGSRHHRPDETGQAQAPANDKRPSGHLVKASTELPRRVVPEN